MPDPTPPAGRRELRREREDRRSRRARATVAALVALVVLALVGFFVLRADHGDSPEQGTEGPKATTATEAPTTSTVPPFTSTIAQASVPQVKVFGEPGAPTPVQTFDHPVKKVDGVGHEYEVPLVFLVDERREDGWLNVLLPIRPNGSTGWIRAEDVQLSETRYHITVELGAHRITVYNGEQIVDQEPVGVGVGNTPTPGGRYYIKELLETPDPDGAYGPFAYGLSGFSEVLTEFSGGPGDIGIHGTNEPSALGQDVSHGCIRMSNEGITKLAGLLPLGTPVEIVP